MPCGGRFSFGAASRGNSGLFGLLIGVLVAGIAMRLVQQKRQSPLLPEVARIAVWLPVLTVDLGSRWADRGWSMVRERTDQMRSSNGESGAPTRDPVPDAGTQASPACSW